MTFDFIDDMAMRNYCVRIAEEMVASFGISEQEACVRVAHFASAINPTSNALVLHRSIRYWAEGIYYRWNEAGEMTNEPKPLPRGFG